MAVEFILFLIFFILYGFKLPGLLVVSDEMILRSDADILYHSPVPSQLNIRDPRDTAHDSKTRFCMLCVWMMQDLYFGSDQPRRTCV